MSFFISDAVAETAVPTIETPVATTAVAGTPSAIQEPGWEGMLFPIGILVFFYFLFLRPQSKRNKEHKKTIEDMTVGAEVVTNGGLLGKVIDLDDNFLQLEVANNVVLQVQRHQVGSVMPKGTYKTQMRKVK